MVKFYRIISSPYTLILSILVLFPMVLILTQGLVINNSFSLSAITDILSKEAYTTSIKNSFIMATKTTILTIIVAIPICLSMWRMKKSTKTTITLLITLPLWVNLVARARSINLIFQDLTFISPSDKVVIALMMIYLPFMVIAINSQLDKIKFSLIESAVDLGASKIKVFYSVIIPLILPGILSGINLVLLPSATSIVVPKIIDSKSQTIGNTIDDLATPDNMMFAAAIAIILMIIMLSSIIIIEKWSRRINDGKN